MKKYNAFYPSNTKLDATIEGVKITNGHAVVIGDVLAKKLEAQGFICEAMRDQDGNIIEVEESPVKTKAPTVKTEEEPTPRKKRSE